MTDRPDIDSLWPKSFDFVPAQERWYRYWEEKGYFSANALNQPGQKPYCIVIPPPNVTGSLHMGHALNNTLQDILIRFKRMQGCNTLWMPGTDHAGIATQNVVERQLKAEGKSRHALGREAFVQRVWKWKAESGGVIINQLKRLGASCDWRRERFTLDEGLSRAVREVFVRLHKEGLIFRALRLINWCPRCHTALSDIEAPHHDIEGAFYYIRYPIAGQPGRHVLIATTRPETLLGDTAVAVHPEDERYLDLHHARAVLPLMGREIPFIADPYVDREFGTGALKVTPGHDFNDFALGKKHALEEINIFTIDAKINENGGAYAGLDRFAARARVVEDLKEQGLLEKIEPRQQSVGHCYRCETIIEPYLSLQWFVKTQPLAHAAAEAVREGKTRILPEMWEKTYFNWMDNIQDWCISRQIWWGHTIPAWHCASCAHVMVEKEAPTSCEKCGGALTPDPDVLDTWFSSALWPFSTLGWPDNTAELETFYPTSALVTAFDILFFWVARMMMMGIHFMGEAPFKDVYIHALVRDAEGQKMSKSKGNVIDPLAIMDQYGTDAFRFTLAAMAAQGRDIKLDEQRIAGYRRFIQKIWNAFRFAAMNLDGYAPPNPFPLSIRELGAVSPTNQWILARLQRCVASVTHAIDHYAFNEAASAVYDFFWHDLCDWYLELIKPVLSGDDAAMKAQTQTVLLFTLDHSLRLLHPFMPFITEDLYQRLPVHGESIMIAEWPNLGEEALSQSMSGHASDIQAMIAIIETVRNIRGENLLKPSQLIDAHISVSSAAGETAGIRGYSKNIEKLAGVKSLTFGPPPSNEKEFIQAQAGEVMVYIPRAQLADVGEEKRRLEKELAKIEKDIEFNHRKLDDPKFKESAPPEVVKKTQEKLDESLKRKELLLANLANL